jgi:hypothetical protein
MKNRYQEHLKKSAKLYHRNKRNSNFTEGLIQYHQNGEERSTSLSWWDDVDFILNDYRVVVAWIHPRYDYQDYIETEARKRIAHLDTNMGDIFNEATPNYVKAGQSRKKISNYTVNLTKDSDEWAAAYKLALQEIPHAIEYQAKPYIKTEWLARGYSVDICAPIEIRGIEDLVKLVTLVKRLLKCETTLDSEFPDYVYTKEQWLTEASKTEGK